MIHARADYNRIQDPEGKIGKDEPVFMVRAQDRLFIDIVNRYIMKTLEQPDHDPKIVECLIPHIARARKWQEKNVTKTADLPDNYPEE